MPRHALWACAAGLHCGLAWWAGRTRPKWMLWPDMYLRSPWNFRSSGRALEKPDQEIFAMSITHIKSDRMAGHYAFFPSALSQERLQLFVAEVDRRKRAAALGYSAGLGLVAALALVVLGRIFA